MTTNQRLTFTVTLSADGEIDTSNKEMLERVIESQILTNIHQHTEFEQMEWVAVRVDLTEDKRW